jgi:acyl-CoA thioester hydrolase
MSQAVFRWQHRISYAECTVGNHVYYARYLDMLERARGAFLRHVGLSFRQLQEQAAIFPVIEVRLRYRAPARYDDVIGVEVEVTRAEGIRLNFRYRVIDSAGGLLIEGETHHVCTSLEDRPCLLPRELLDVLQPWVILDGSPPATGK